MPVGQGICCAMNVLNPKVTWKKIEVMSRVGIGCAMISVLNPVPVP